MFGFINNEQEYRRASLADQMSLTLSMDSDTFNCTHSITWTDLSVQVSNKCLSVKNELNEQVYSVPRLKTKSKTILKTQSGAIRSGTLVALMGPSGSGKTTLLNTLSGRKRDGVSGVIQYHSKNGQPLKLSYVPQKDVLCPELTVRQTLDFSYEFKKDQLPNCDQVISKIVDNLNLEDCLDTKVGSCSGGQVKRVAVAVELISSPNVIILDEPTSGLDASNAEILITVLRNLLYGPSPPAIVCSIHQPSYEVFQGFDAAYVLTGSGHKMFHGKPLDVPDFLIANGFKCPEYCNPADYLLKLACKSKEGHKLVSQVSSLSFKYSGKNKRLSRTFSFEATPRKSNLTESLKEQQDILAKTSHGSLHHLNVLMKRNSIIFISNPISVALRLAFSVLLALCWQLLYTYPIGQADGCWSSLVGFNFDRTANESVLSIVTKLSTNSGSFLDRLSTIQDNYIFLLMNANYVIFVHSLITVVQIPKEIETVIWEVNNNWYSIRSYFIAKCLFDVPICILSVSIFTSLSYWTTGQIMVWWRFGLFLAIIILLALIAESVGTLFGALFAGDIISATLCTITHSFPNILYGGFFVRVSKTPFYTLPLTWISYMRHAFEGLILTIYGFERCLTGTSKNFNINQKPLQLIASVFENLRIDHKDGRPIAPYLEVNDNCMESIINGTLDILGVTADRAASASLELIGPNDTDSVMTMNSGSNILDEDFNTGSSSYPLSFFSIKDEDLYRCFGCLVIILFIYRVLAYLALVRAVHRKN